MEINTTIENLTAELSKGQKKEQAIALDFDGVCKLFTHHKHQIMRTCLFLHLYEFQRVSFTEFQKAYEYINFRSEVAGKERFLCADALARNLTEQGYDLELPGLHKAVDELKEKGLKLSAENIKKYDDADDVKRALSWSDEINEKVSALTEISLTPGILEHILTPFKDPFDMYVVTTAAAETLPPIMEKEGVDYILRYIGQETATKTEALTALSRAGYTSLFMFGDSIEDSRATDAASENVPVGVSFYFVPVIPGDEEASFAAGKEIIELTIAGDEEKALKISLARKKEFEGKEVVA